MDDSNISKYGDYPTKSSPNKILFIFINMKIKYYIRILKDVNNRKFDELLKFLTILVTENKTNDDSYIAEDKLYSFNNYLFNLVGWLMKNKTNGYIYKVNKKTYSKTYDYIGYFKDKEDKIITKWYNDKFQLDNEEFNNIMSVRRDILKNSSLFNLLGEICFRIGKDLEILNEENTSDFYKCLNSFYEKIIDWQAKIDEYSDLIIEALDLYDNKEFHEIEKKKYQEKKKFNNSKIEYKWDKRKVKETEYEFTSILSNEKKRSEIINLENGSNINNTFDSIKIKIDKLQKMYIALLAIDSSDENKIKIIREVGSIENVINDKHKKCASILHNTFN